MTIPATANNGKHLLVVCANPPTTSGLRTLNRADMARAALNFDTVEVTNLFGLPTYRVDGISEEGAELHGWLSARTSLVGSLERADAVVLAYGVTSPSGEARNHYRTQVAWLDAELEARSLPVWWVGGAPRHPSRWQRFTYRAHVDVPFPEALAMSFTQR